jgi:CubicO group peptidase (beta-lactamase class C family)
MNPMLNDDGDQRIHEQRLGGTQRSLVRAVIGLAAFSLAFFGAHGLTRSAHPSNASTAASYLMLFMSLALILISVRWLRPRPSRPNTFSRLRRRIGVVSHFGGVLAFLVMIAVALFRLGLRVTADTVFHIASVSKTVTGSAMMMLWQDGAFKLDDPVAPHLDFRVANPKFPDMPITFRHLFTHTSSISNALYDKLDFTVKVPPVLHDFLAGYLSPGGQWFDPDKSYSAAKPGMEYSYSDVGVALLGYLAGRVNRDPLDVLTQKRLFGPLGLRNTAWRYAGIADNRLALPYSFENAHYHQLPKQTYPDWPAGLLCTSANDFAKFLEIYTQGGSVGGRNFFEPKTIATMLTPDPVLPSKDHPDARQGLIWQLRSIKGSSVALHSGRDPGAATIAVFGIDRPIGALAFANIAPDEDRAPFTREIIERLLDKAGSA